MREPMTVSELIEAICCRKERESWPDGYRFEQHWVALLKADLYRGGFNELDWNSEEDESVSNLDLILEEAFEDALRALYHFAPVLVNDDPEDEEESQS